MSMQDMVEAMRRVKENQHGRMSMPTGCEQSFAKKILFQDLVAALKEGVEGVEKNSELMTHALGVYTESPACFEFLLWLELREGT